jgi:hypothetical protein
MASKKATKKKVAKRETHTRKVSPPVQEYYVVADDLSGSISTARLRDDEHLSGGIPLHNTLEDAKNYADSWDSDTLPVIYKVTPFLRGTGLTRSIKFEPYIEQ